VLTRSHAANHGCCASAPRPQAVSNVTTVSRVGTDLPSSRSRTVEADSPAAFFSSA
jgi:hypothetical protein